MKRSAAIYMIDQVHSSSELPQEQGLYALEKSKSVIFFLMTMGKQRKQGKRYMNVQDLSLQKIFHETTLPCQMQKTTAQDN